MKELGRKTIVLLLCFVMATAFGLTACSNEKAPAADTVKVSFNLNYDGAPAAPADKDVVYGEPYGELPAVTRANYTLDGWYFNKRGTGEKVTAQTPVQDRVPHTLYAKWTGETVDISFDLNGGAVDGATEVPGRTVTLGERYGMAIPDAPTKEGYQFSHWYILENGKETIVSEASIVTVDTAHTLHAKFVEVKTFLTFDTEEDLLYIESRQTLNGMETTERNGKTWAKITFEDNETQLFLKNMHIPAGSVVTVTIDFDADLYAQYMTEEHEFPGVWLHIIDESGARRIGPQVGGVGNWTGPKTFTCQWPIDGTGMSFFFMYNSNRLHTDKLPIYLTDIGVKSAGTSHDWIDMSQAEDAKCFENVRPEYDLGMERITERNGKNWMKITPAEDAPASGEDKRNEFIIAINDLDLKAGDTFTITVDTDAASYEQYVTEDHRGGIDGWSYGLAFLVFEGYGLDSKRVDRNLDSNGKWKGPFDITFTVNQNCATVTFVVMMFGASNENAHNVPVYVTDIGKKVATDWIDMSDVRDAARFENLRSEYDLGMERIAERNGKNWMKITLAEDAPASGEDKRNEFIIAINDLDLKAGDTFTITVDTDAASYEQYVTEDHRGGNDTWSYGLVVQVFEGHGLSSRRIDRNLDSDGEWKGPFDITFTVNENCSAVTFVVMMFGASNENAHNVPVYVTDIGKKVTRNWIDMSQAEDAQYFENVRPEYDLGMERITERNGKNWMKITPAAAAPASGEDKRNEFIIVINDLDLKAGDTFTITFDIDAEAFEEYASNDFRSPDDDWSYNVSFLVFAGDGTDAQWKKVDNHPVEPDAAWDGPYTYTFVTENACDAVTFVVMLFGASNENAHNVPVYVTDIGVRPAV